MSTPPALSPLPIASLVFPSLASTNGWLRDHRHMHAGPTLCVALAQTHGVGQRGNAWSSLPGDATFSLYLPHLRIPAARYFALSQIAALATTHWLSQRSLKAHIKWPNDILIEGKKIAGILIETFTAGRRIQGAIIGIGLNIARRAQSQMQFPYPITTLANETGQTAHAPTCALCIAHRILALLSTPPRQAMHRVPHHYQQLLYRQGIPTRFHDADGPFLGQITHVAPDGRLCIRDAHGAERRYAFKEVQMLHELPPYAAIDPPRTAPPAR